jgi:hypothetical protein
MLVPGAIINIVKDPFDILFVQFAESFIISLYCPVKVYLSIGI